MSYSERDYVEEREQGGNGMAIASLILGVLSLFCSILTAIPAIILGIIAVLNAQKRQNSGTASGLALAGIIVAMAAVVFQLLVGALLLPAIQAAREAARRNQSMNNMKQIELAMLNYHDAKRKFPPAASVGKDGKPGLSWRVHILPYIEEQGLYQQFHLDEPWDSPHNNALIPRMPEIYASPNSLVDKEGRTVYLTPRGPDTVFPEDQQLTLQGITDGTSRTIALLEVSDKSAVIWTKPDDYDVNRPNLIEGIVGQRPRGFLAGLADGSVRFLPDDIDENSLRALFTRAGKEDVDPSQF
jgi:hypothetical protein